MDIANLKRRDIGRRVIYEPQVGDAAYRKSQRQPGVIHTWNDDVIFVRFKGAQPQACSPNDLTFETPNGRR